MLRRRIVRVFPVLSVALAGAVLSASAVAVPSSDLLRAPQIPDPYFLSLIHI